MATQAQALANQNNAQHSTGPKTDAGKSSSRLNAFRHGLTAATIVLPSEDFEAYKKASRDLLAEPTPAGPLEKQLAQTIVDTQWRLNRIGVLETDLLSLAQLEPAPAHLAALDDLKIRAALLEANALIVQSVRRFAERAKERATQPEIGFDFSSHIFARTPPRPAPKTSPEPPPVFEKFAHGQSTR